MLKKSESRIASASSPVKKPAQESALAHSGAVEQDFNYDQDDDYGVEGDSVEDTARYIADMIASLAYIAREAKLDLLTYLLDMARVEAEMQARQSETPFADD
jgi:hypothetical protein